MDKKQRMDMLKKAQNPPPTGQAATAVTPGAAASVPPNAPAKIDIRTIPNFNINLFAIKPEVVGDINNIANIINKNLSVLSQGKVTFPMVWTNPSITGTEFTNSVKNLLNLAKWLYNVMKSRAQAYSLDGLRAIATGLMDTVKTYSFPEDNASTVQSDLMQAGTTMLAKLGTSPK